MLRNTTLRLISRWGTTIYETTNYDNTWKGEGISEGVYFYEIGFPNGGKEYKGWFQILD